MNKLAVLFFAAAVCVCCVSAFPSSLSSGGYVRVVRAALPDPDPHRYSHHGYRPHSYGGDYYSGYDNYDNYDRNYYQGYGGYGNNYYPYQNNGQSSSSSNANAASFNSPWGSGAYASANSASGSGGGLLF